MKALRNLTDDQLCEMYGTADEATQDRIRRECDRRDADDRRRAANARKAAAVKARRDALVTEWLDYAQAQWLAAEYACNGVLLNRAGLAAGIDPRSLWRGSAVVAERLASEELLEFWAKSPRITRTQYIDARQADRRAERLAYAA
ncbi:hypothetical protein [Streptomyces sp. NPDC056683]|uniref:hypothetical protein n=1 Tax=Streptomyces sp. NPDC056683 TaxID=3345910 RepID=UPI00367C1365